MTKKDTYLLLVLSFIVIVLGMLVLKLSIDELAKEPLRYIYHTEYFQIPEARVMMLMIITMVSGFGMISALVIMIKILLVI